MDENTDIALRGVRYAQDQFSEVVTQAEEFVREKPGQSLLIALLAGFILNRLPIGRLFGGLLARVRAQAGAAALRRNQSLRGHPGRRISRNLRRPE